MKQPPLLWIRAHAEHDLRRLAGRGRRFQCASCESICALRKTRGKPARVVFREGGLWVERFHACVFSDSNFILLRRVISKLAAVLEFAQPTNSDDMTRVDGRMVCDACGCEYRRHIHDPYMTDLTILCGPERERVKL